MQLKSRILLVDGDNLCHRVYHKFKGLTSKAGKDSTLMYGVPYLLLSYIKKLNADRIFVAFDGGRSIERRKVLPTYKEREINLSLDYDAFSSQKDLLKYNLPSLGVGTIFGPKMEADDLIYTMIKQLGKEHYFTIISSDKDFTQLIGQGVSIYNPFKEMVINPLNCKKVMGYTPQQAVDYLILDGDKSDKIPGVRGMGPVKISQFLSEFESIEEYLEAPKGNWPFQAIKEAYERNNILINLRLYYHKFGKKDKPTTLYPAFNKASIQPIFSDYNINLLNNTENLSHFKKLT